MSTPKAKLSEREMRLIRILRDDVLFVSRPQVEMLLGLNNRRANERLAKLVEERILRKRMRLDTYDNFRSPIYYLGLEGCKMIGLPKWEIERYLTRIRNYADRSIGHLLEVYDVFIKFSLESKVTEWMWHDDAKWFSIELGLYPDGYVQFEKDAKKYSAFVEADRGTESVGVVKEKFRKYARFHRSGGFQRLFGQRRFRVLFITTTEERIEEMEREHPSDDIWFAIKKDFMRDSLWARHWFARDDFYSLDAKPLPEAPEPPRLATENVEPENSREEERQRRQQLDEEARTLGHEINNRMAWGSLYGFLGLWGIALVSLRPLISLIVLLIVLYVAIFSDS